MESVLSISELHFFPTSWHLVFDPISLDELGHFVFLLYRKAILAAGLSRKKNTTSNLKRVFLLTTNSKQLRSHQLLPPLLAAAKKLAYSFFNPAIVVVPSTCPFFLS